MSDCTVMIVDDHPVFRGGLRALLDSTDGLSVVGEAADGGTAVDLAVQLRPDVVLMDLHMPGGITGVESTRQLAARAPDVQVLILTMFDDDESVFAAMRAGAAGYLLKDADQGDVIRSILTVAAGGAVFGPTVAERMRQVFAAGPARTSPFPQLTAREEEVLDLLAAGLDNATIARRLHVAPKTVRNTVSTIFMKLQVADRSQAIVRARDAGLGRGA